MEKQQKSDSNKHGLHHLLILLCLKEIHILGLGVRFDVDGLRGHFRLRVIRSLRSHISRQIQLLRSEPRHVMHDAQSLRSPRSLHEPTAPHRLLHFLPAASRAAVPAPVALVLLDGHSIRDWLVHRLLRPLPRRSTPRAVVTTVRVVRDRAFLVGIPRGNASGDLVLVADVVEFGDAMARRRVQTAHVAGVRAQHALHEMLRVSRLVTLAAEVGGAAEASEV